VWCGKCYSSSPLVEFYRQVDDREVHRLVADNPKANLWKHKKTDLNEFIVARDGDHLLTTFQCDLCIFRRVLQREPIEESHAYKRILAFVRRINLDAFWARATSTVKNNLGIVLRDIAAMKNLGLPASYFDPGPSPAFDHAGYEAAISVIEDTRRPGKYANDHKQWDSSRKVKSAIGSFERTAVCSPLSYLALVDGEQVTILILETSLLI
jgi:hypothetical protein